MNGSTTRRNRTLTVIGAAALGLALSACGSGSTAPSGASPGSAPATAAASATDTAPGTPAGSTPGSDADSGAAPSATGSGGGNGTALCAFAQLSVTQARQGNAGMGHVGTWLLFRNTGSRGCMLYGYPGVAALDPAGRQVLQAQRTLSGYLGGVENGHAMPHVALAPGAVASAVVEGSDVPSGSATSCPEYAGLLVTPPNTRQSVTLRVRLPSCQGLQVHPVVPGTSGMLQ